MSAPFTPPRIPTRHLERYREVAGVLAEEGFDWLVEQTGLARLVPRGLRKRRHPESTFEQRVRHAVERLGVTFIKGGQALSTRTDVVSPAMSAELSKLQDDVTALPFATMRAVLESEFETTLERAFATFDEVPLGAASIGQVYRATMHDGTSVAVKVQRPDVKARAETDIDITMTLARRLLGDNADFGDLDLVGLVGEFAEALRSEFDYVSEASNIDRLRREMADDGTVVIPRVYWTHTTSRVLTTDLLDGVRMNRIEELDAAGLDREVLALNGINAYLRMIFEVGFFHADPHPGNFIALPGNRVGFTDFGRCGSMSPSSRERFIDLLHAIVDRDDQAAAETLLDLASRPDIDEAALERDVSSLTSRYFGKELGRVNATEMFGETLALFRNNHLGIPNDFAVMLATLAVLEGVGTMLDPAFDFAPAIAPFVERAMGERMRPERVAQRLAQDLRRVGRMAERFPASFDRIMRRAARGEFRLEVVPRDYESLLDRITELVNRLAFAIVVAALIVGATTLLSATSVPGWLSTVGQIGLVAALFVTFWLFGSIIAAHYRAGRRR